MVGGGRGGGNRMNWVGWDGGLKRGVYDEGTIGLHERRRMSFECGMH